MKFFTKINYEHNQIAILIHFTLFVNNKLWA